MAWFACEEGWYALIKLYVVSLPFQQLFNKPPNATKASSHLQRTW